MTCMTDGSDGTAQMTAGRLQQCRGTHGRRHSKYDGLPLEIIASVPANLGPFARNLKADVFASPPIIYSATSPFTVDVKTMCN